MLRALRGAPRPDGFDPGGAAAGEERLGLPIEERERGLGVRPDVVRDLIAEADPAVDAEMLDAQAGADPPRGPAPAGEAAAGRTPGAV